MSEKKPVLFRAPVFLKRVESVVLFVIAIVLALLAVLLLVSSVQALYVAVIGGQIRDQAIEILDSVLLVMMTMEIVYTITLSLESHKLVAEPFLVVGAIAAIRRMLVITADSTKIENQPILFQNSLYELGLLAVTILFIAASIYILRRSQKFLPPSGEDEA
ncbi:MAG: phosphate-starvation-inducible PsiE family protein [Anaerolineales bacterium]